MGKFTHELVMRRGSWHARWYRHWLDLGGSEPPYKENLCRYVRVLLFYAPVRWFTLGRVGKLAPWEYVTAALTVAAVAVASYEWGSIALMVVWVSASVAAGATLLGLAIYGLVNLYGRDADTFLKWVKWLTVPLWVLPYLIALGALGLAAIIRAFYHRHRSGFEHVILGMWVTFVVSGVLSLMALLAYGFYDDPYQTGIVLGTVLFCIGSLLVFIGLVMSGKLNTTGRKMSGVVDTVKLGATYAATKKRGSRICPFVEIEE